ncbi:hypothetical protein E3E22_11055, partial [Thermococcus sp. MV5]
MRKGVYFLIFVCIGIFSYYSPIALAGIEIVSISHSGSSWGVLEEANGTYSLLIVSGGKLVSKIRLNPTGEPCGLAWNGSEWIVET